MMADGRVSLPMYDWPEVEWATDGLWSAIRAALADQGIAAPEQLERGAGPMAVWAAEDLLLSQTCGLVYAQVLAGRVFVIGALDMALPGCGPAEYRSAIVTRPGADWAELAGSGVPACNEAMSQSGYRVLLGVAARIDEAVMTGAHRASVQAVAEGHADFAAIDMATWRLALAHEPAAAALEVVGMTPPTPGVPVIVGQGVDADATRRAVATGIGAAGDDVRAALGVAGFVAMDGAAYLAAYGASGSAARATAAQ